MQIEADISVYTEETVHFEEIDLKRESTDCVINGYYDKEREIHILLWYLFVGFFLGGCACFATSIFTINSPGTDSKGDKIKACQKMCAAV